MNSQRPSHLAFFTAAACLAFALSSCTGLSAPSPTPAGTQQSTSAVTTPPTSTPAEPTTASTPTSMPSGPVSDGRSSVALTTHTGMWEDVEYSFDHPSDWIVEDTTSGPEPGVVIISGPDMEPLASLTILTAWGAECPCVTRPAVYLGDWVGDAPLSGSGPFVVRSTAMDLSAFPQDREANNWPDNVRVVTSLSSNTDVASTDLLPRLMYGLGSVETGVVATNGETRRTILFASSEDFGTLQEARTYAGSDEHREVQAMIASFREGKG